MLAQIFFILAAALGICSSHPWRIIRFRGPIAKS
jgi:hypothetical protein